ncbi:FecR domain-containing protein [Rhizobium sp. L1K21]|uniref:FecR family protein n=1 Tax=Rhizobium sp. L1K21 TaxID=2954933 RepID=UPI0020924DB5|nr:FecR family protein [Rhizobium sp. L1K21]MCO6187522.1 FecR family protein [Rhizobium sp. L1K21]
MQSLSKRADKNAISRRALLGGVVSSAVLMSIRSSEASGDLGFVVQVRGLLSRSAGDGHQRLESGNPLLDGDLVSTGEESSAELKLGGDTRILLGPQTSLFIDSFIAGQGGVLELASGQMIFDRPEGLPKIDVSVRTAFGMIGVRGTKFFAGPNRGAFSVFVEHGKVEVTNAGVSRRLLRGQGLDIRPPESAPRSLGKEATMAELSRLAVPSIPQDWEQSRIAEAYSSIGLE